MTFTAPYSGTFAYKGIIPSSFLNNINTDIPKSLDKTGDTSATGGGISGIIDILSGGALAALSGSSIDVLSGANLNLYGGIINVALGGYIEVSTGGYIKIDTGNVLNNQGLIQCNGNNGGNPSLQLQDSSYMQLNNSAYISMQAGNLLKLGGTTLTGVFPTFISGQYRTVIQNILTGVDGTNSGAFPWAIYNGSISDWQTNGGAVWYIPITGHQGANLAQVSLLYTIGSTHTAPTGSNRLSISLILIDVATGSTSTIAQAYASSYTAGSTYITITPNCVIDTTTYIYTLMIQDEISSGAVHNSFASPFLYYSNITSAQWA